MLLKIVRRSCSIALVMAAVAVFLVLDGAAPAQAQSGVIISTSRDATIRLGRPDPASGAWISLPTNAEATLQFKNDRGNNIVVGYYPLPPGKYGVVFLSEYNTNYHGRMLASGSGGSGGTYAHALAEFSVSAGEVVDVGYISGWSRSTNSNDVTTQIFAKVPKGGKLVKRALVIRQ